MFFTMVRFYTSLAERTGPQKQVLDTRRVMKLYSDTTTSHRGDAARAGVEARTACHTAATANAGSPLLQATSSQGGGNGGVVDQGLVGGVHADGGVVDQGLVDGVHADGGVVDQSLVDGVHPDGGVVDQGLVCQRWISNRACRLAVH